MQAFKLVNAGYVDRVIVFDSLPERLLHNVRTREAAGFPRSWARWLGEIGSTRTVFKTETTVDQGRNWSYKHTPIGKEPCFFILEYADINADKQRWREISEYVRMNAGEKIRLKEKMEEMAIPFGADPTKELSIEPQDVFDPETGTGHAYIPLPDEVKKISEETLVAPEEQIIVEETAPKRRGRPKKAVVEA